MKQLFDDLWQTNTHSSGPLNTHAYFLKTDKGNLLIYSTPHNKDLDEMKNFGGITHQLISHRDELSPILTDIKEMFGSQLLCDAKEVEQVEKYCKPDILVEDKLELDCGVLVFHTPGHTIGSCSFWYESPKSKKYLFTGDSFFPWDGKLSTFVLPHGGGNNEMMKESLRIYQQYEPDVVLCSGSIGSPFVIEVTNDQWQEALGRNIENL